MVFENAQDHDFQYYVGEKENGVRKKKVSYEPNEKVVNCGTLTVVKEDHTIANLLRHQLLSQERVRFAAYQMQRPLRNDVLIRVETANSTHTPLMAVDCAFDALITEFSQIDQRFKVRVCAPCAALGLASALRRCANSAPGFPLLLCPTAGRGGEEKGRLRGRF